MPKLSDDAIFARAINPALQDRITLADAYSNEGPNAETALEQGRAIKALTGKRLDKMTPAEQEAAYLCLACAEQWESSLADANPGAEAQRAARRNAQLFRELRHRRWGKSRLEVAIENSKAVSVFELMETTPNSPAGKKNTKCIESRDTGRHASLDRIRRVEERVQARSPTVNWSFFEPFER